MTVSRIGVGTEGCHCITAACVNALAIRLLKVAACDKMAGLAQEKVSAPALLQKLLQQPIHNFGRVQMIARTFVGVFCIAYVRRSANNPLIATWAPMYVLLPVENLHSRPTVKCKLSVSRTIYLY